MNYLMAVEKRADKNLYVTFKAKSDQETINENSANLIIDPKKIS
jgi:hypothetical protein